MPYTRFIPSVPEIGHGESYYAQRVRQAERLGDEHSREANKVAQYITLAISPHLEWDQKLKYFRHALRRHCNPPAMASDPVCRFYGRLADMVRQYCGQEALKLASREDDRYAAMVQQGYDRTKLQEEARAFFERLMGSRPERPEHFNQEDWEQLRIVRDQWT
jgi:hypothetical protein